jgi:nucleoside-diphosphate-sugar epimerase
MLKILVTGANGFVGRHVCEHFVQHGYFVRAAVRSKAALDSKISYHESVVVGEIDSGTDWLQAVNGIDIIVHLAARVHKLNDDSYNPLQDYRRVNVDGTVNLVNTAIKSKVKKVIFLSSIKVNGEATQLNHPFTEKDYPKPQDAYGLSKFEAEQKLHQLAEKHKVDLAIIRPPLIYGPGVGANFLKLVNLVKKIRLLPFGLVKNKRSLLYVGNLCDALVKVIDYSDTLNDVFLVCDSNAVSLRSLVCMISKVLHRRILLLPFPCCVLNYIFKLLGKSAESNRLLGSLEIDSSHIQTKLDWRPKFTVEEGLRSMLTGLYSAE